MNIEYLEYKESTKKEEEEKIQIYRIENDDRERNIERDN